MKFEEMMFYAEAEGLLPTRAGKINAVIKEVKKYPSAEIGYYEFCDILGRYGLIYDDLSEAEKRYINASIA